MSLEKFNPILQTALLKSGITELTPLQSQLIKPYKSGADLLVFAPDSSGKSTSIAMQTIEKLRETSPNPSPRALIITADIESAGILETQLNQYAYGSELHVTLVHDRGNSVKERITLYEGTDIVVGTLKRIALLYNQNGIHFKDLKLVVIDDCEKMLAKGEQGQLLRLGESLSKTQQVIYNNCSTERLELFAEKMLLNPSVIEMD